MEYSVEELKSALIERCKNEGILYATVAMDMLFSSQESVDSEAVEMIELIKKSVQYKTNQKSPYGVDGITGEIFEARLF